MRAVLYMRVSTKDQVLENQRIRLKQYCERKGWDIVGEYTDKISGRKARRPGLDKLLRDGKKRKYDIVVAWKLDRLGRSLKHLWQTVDRLDHYGIELAFSEQEIDTTTAMGRFFFTVIGAVAELELDMISDRIKAGQERARVKGKRIGRKPISEKYSQETIDQVLSMRESGLSYGKISEITGISKGTLHKIVQEFPPVIGGSSPIEIDTVQETSVLRTMEGGQ